VRRVYVASSWRNPIQPAVIDVIRMEGHDVYDFRHPAPGDNGFHWSEIDPDWRAWDAAGYLAGLHHPLAEVGFNRDHAAMEWADTFVLVLPCGNSAHLELGWACGAGKRTAILIGHPLDVLDDGVPAFQPELMYKEADLVTDSWVTMMVWINEGVM